MADVSISPADLRTIERNMGAIENNLKVIYNNLDVLDGRVTSVNNKVGVVCDEISGLAREFHDFVKDQMKANRLGQAETRLVKIRQELEMKFGHYDLVRRTTTGILQADDLGIVRKETISTATEELMISTPNYWLTPCLVALAAWISDQPELADKALREGIRRNDEKTSLFFALVCRRADRKQACLKWTQRYLANQDEEQLDRKAVIIIDAFACGLLGADSEGVIARQMEEWMEHLSEKPGFVEKQTKQWSDAIILKRQPVRTDSYVYLKKYSNTWPILEDILEGACLHATILSYFTSIFEQEASTDSVKVQLDEILTSLVTDFDDEELPLRKEEKYEQLVVNYSGDENRTKQDMTLEESSFDTYKDFTQLLTDASMKPDTSHASVATQKFAIALSREWVSNAYNDVVAQNRIKIPHEIDINISNFNAKTTDGQNEQELVSGYNTLLDTEKASALAQCVLTSFDKFCLTGGAVVAAIGLFMILTGSTFLGLIAAVAGVGMMINYNSKKKQIETNRQNIETQFEAKRTNGVQIIRAVLAEVVDFRAEFAEKDAESQKVVDFLEQIAPEQYVRKIADSNRRIRV